MKKANHTSKESEELSGQKERDWTAWMKNHASEVQYIDSLEQDTYEDLDYLKRTLKDKRIVMLGESTHGAAEFTSLKERMVQYLHKKLDFDVLVFESGFGETFSADLQATDLSSIQTMQQAVHPGLHTHELLKLFHYLKSTKMATDSLCLNGIDIQPIGTYGSFLRKWFTPLNPVFAEKAEQLELQFADGFKGKNIDQYQNEKEQLITGYLSVLQFVGDNAVPLQAFYPETDHIIPITIRVIQERIHTIQFLLDRAIMGNKHAAEKNYDLAQTFHDEVKIIRDISMAQHLRWLAEVQYPERKIIVWAHNYHIRKQNNIIKNHRSPLPSMGQLLPEKLKRESYVIGFYMDKGQTAAFDQSPVTVLPDHPAGSVESIMSQDGLKNSFVDLTAHLHTKETSWMFTEQQALESGIQPEWFIPIEQYDGIQLVSKVTLPHYIHHYQGE